MPLRFPVRDLKAEARDVLAQAQASARSTQDQTARTSALSTIALMLVLVGETREALALAGGLSDRVLSAGYPAKAATLGAIALAQAKQGDFVAARVTADKVSGDLHASVLSGIAKREAPALARAGNVAEARKVAGRSTDALLGVAVEQARRGDLAGALATVHKIEEEEEKRTASTRAKALGALAAVQVARKSAEGSAPVLKAVGAIAAKAEDGPWVLGFFVEAWAAGGDPAGALEAASAIADEEARMYALSHIVRAQVKAGDVVGAQRTAAGMKSGDYAVGALLEVAIHQVETGDRKAGSATLARAVSLLPSVQETGPGAGEKLYAYLGAIVSLRAKLGDLEGVRTMLDRIKKDTSERGLVYLVGEELPAIVVALAESGQPVGAEKIIARFPPRELQAEAWAALARHHRKRRDAAAASRCLAQARKLSREAFGVNYPLALMETGDIVGAEMLLEVGKSGSREDKEIREAMRIELVQEIGRAQALEGKGSALVAWVAKFRSPALRTYALLGVAAGLLEKAGIETFAVTAALS